VCHELSARLAMDQRARAVGNRLHKSTQRHVSKEDRSEISFIIAEAKEHAHMMVKWRVTQAKRECNAIAHNLAHLARRSSDSEVG
jgi:hypothetical protein